MKPQKAEKAVLSWIYKKMTKPQKAEKTVLVKIVNKI